MCARWTRSEHSPEKCYSPVKCVNCYGVHPAYFRSGSKWEAEKEMLTLKTKENFSFPEARRRLSFVQRCNFAEVVRRMPAPTPISVKVQICPQYLNRPRGHKWPQYHRNMNVLLRHIPPELVWR